MSYVLFVLFGTVAWLRPVLGYALFVLLQTPLGNVTDSFERSLSGPVVLILATIRLLMHKSSKRLRAVEVCALALSLVVLLRHAELKSLGFTPAAFVGPLFQAFLWGPLLVAFNRLDDDRIDSLRLWMSAAGIFVGVWGALVYLTGSDYLMRLGRWGDPATSETMGALAGGGAEQVLKGRFVVVGLFTVVPSAYWYVLRGALADIGHHWLRNLAMYAGVGAVLIAVGISVTRSTALLLGMGTVVMLAGPLLVRGEGGGHSRVRALAIGAIAACLLGVAVYLIDITSMIEQYQERFSTLGWNDVNVERRLDSTANAWAYLGRNLSFFGAPGPDPMANFQGSGDTALVPHLWLYYGVPGLVLYLALYLAAFGRLLKCWLAKGLSREQQLLRSMLTAWSIYFVYALIVGYDVTSGPVVFFTMLFFSEIGRLRSRCLPSSYFWLERPAA